MAKATKPLVDDHEDVMDTLKAQAARLEEDDEQDKQEAPEPVYKKSLPVVIGEAVRTVMENHGAANQCARDLQIWYDAQPTENRRELAIKLRRDLETAKQTTDFLYSQFMLISQKDIQ